MPAVSLNAAAHMASPPVEYTRPCAHCFYLRHPPSPLHTLCVTAPLGEPVFVDGTLCELVVDGADGHAFWMCMEDVQDEDYICRCSAKGDRWVWVCSKRWW